MPPKIISSLLFDLLLGSARLRALAAGLAIGAVAAGLFARADDMARLMAVVVIAAGAAAVVCFAADAAPRPARRSFGEQALVFAGCGILAVLHGAQLLG